MLADAAWMNELQMPAASSTDVPTITVPLPDSLAHLHLLSMSRCCFFVVFLFCGGVDASNGRADEVASRCLRQYQQHRVAGPETDCCNNGR